MPRTIRNPTFGQIRRLLADLGFTDRTKRADPDDRIIHVFKHAPSDCVFLFNDRPDAEPMHITESMEVHIQLTWRGLMEDISLDEFLDRFAPAKAG